MAKKYLSISDAAELLGVSYSTLRRRLDTGEIASKRFGERSFRIPVREIRQFVAKSDYHPEGASGDTITKQ
jgi:excisionase family DNA binding protein